MPCDVQTVLDNIAIYCGVRDTLEDAITAYLNTIKHKFDGHTFYIDLARMTVNIETTYYTCGDTYREEYDDIPLVDLLNGEYAKAEKERVDRENTVRIEREARAKRERDARQLVDDRKTYEKLRQQFEGK